MRHDLLLYTHVTYLQWALKVSDENDEKYIIAGLKGLTLSNEVSPMGIFSILRQ
jgi:hypothetical protein